MAYGDWPRRNLGDTFMDSRSMKVAAALVAGVTLLATVGQASAAPDLTIGVGAPDDQFTGWHNGLPAYLYQPAVYGYPFGYNQHPTFGYDYIPGSGYYGPY
jgi:hypothetical protein